MVDYGVKFDTPIIIVMSLFIATAMASVIWLNVVVHKTECVASYTTYCGDSHSTQESHENNDAHSEH